MSLVNWESEGRDARTRIGEDLPVNERLWWWCAPILRKLITSVGFPASNTKLPRAGFGRSETYE